MMPTNPPNPSILSDEALAEIEARANAASNAALQMPRVVSSSSFVDLTAEELAAHEPLPIPFDAPTVEFVRHAKYDIAALCQTVRAAWATNDRYAKVLSDRLREMNVLGESFDKLDAENTALREQLAEARLRTIRVIEAKRDGPTARYAYGGYSRELWHLNVETLKTVCKELLKEVADALAFDTASNPLGNRTDLDAGAIYKAREGKP